MTFPQLSPVSNSPSSFHASQHPMGSAKDAPPQPANQTLSLEQSPSEPTSTATPPLSASTSLSLAPQSDAHAMSVSPEPDTEHEHDTEPKTDPTPAATPPLPIPPSTTIPVDLNTIEHAASAPNSPGPDIHIHQPVSAPALMHRRSAIRSTHKRRPSITAPSMPASHYSKPIEMPPEAAMAGIRLESNAVPANLATLERVQSGNNVELANKLSGSADRRDNRPNGGNTLKKQITKFSKIGGGHRKKVKDGYVVFKGHRNWEIVLSIQFGLRYTSELLEDASDTEPTAKDYEESLAFDFNPVDDQRSPFEVNKFAKWVHPAPFVYKAIRRRFGISETDFLEATCAESRVRELPTPGKSGALFYITDDENFFMKTIQHIEEKMLVSMLPSYYEHIRNNPDTLLTRYMAHFSVHTRRDRHIRMVVMASVFTDTLFIDRKYDLKGSTYKRYASEEQLQSENVTLKDQDFHNPIFFSNDVVNKITGQLAKDSSYLESHNVMDYSLLLGVSDMLEEEDAMYKEMFGPEEEDAPYFVGYQKGANGEKFGVRVSMGIIDFLQRFRLRKKVEYGCRVMQSCSASAASVAPPHLYRERFMEFLSTKLLPDPEFDIADLMFVPSPDAKVVPVDSSHSPADAGSG